MFAWGHAVTTNLECGGVRRSIARAFSLCQQVHLVSQLRAGLGQPSMLPPFAGIAARIQMVGHLLVGSPVRLNPVPELGTRVEEGAAQAQDPVRASDAEA